MNLNEQTETNTGLARLQAPTSATAMLNKGIVQVSTLILPKRDVRHVFGEEYKAIMT